MLRSRAGFDTPLSACDSVNKGFYESETSSVTKNYSKMKYIFFLRRGSIPAVFICSNKSKSTVKVAIKREESQTRLSFSECEQARGAASIPLSFR